MMHPFYNCEVEMADYQEKELIHLIFAMYQLSGGSHGEVFRTLPEKEQTVCRSVVFSKLFFNIDAHNLKKEYDL
jgi:hypothetical protein